MKKIYLLLLLCLTSYISFGQITLLSGTGDGGFETGTTFAANNWTVDNNSLTTRVWQIGTGQTGYSGSRGAFIGNSSTNVGSNTAARTVHLYRTVAFPLGATNITLSFKYKQAVADPTFDYCKVYLNSSAPSTGTIPSTGLISTELPGSSAYSSFTLVSIGIPVSYAGTTQVLDFMFNSDAVTPHGYGAVDSVAITYVPSPIIAVTPTSLAFGSVVTSTNSTAQTYTVSAANLSPASGNITVTAPSNFQVSNNGSTWSSSYTIAYTSGSLSSTTGYARFNPTAATTYSGNITIAGGGATTNNIAVTGTGIPMCSGTPTAGTTTATTSNGCSGYSSTLSLTGSTSGVGGLTYQWQSSPTGSSWSNITGATNATYALTVSSTAYYRCTVTCTATSLSASSTSLQLSTSVCTSMPTSGTSSLTTGCSGSTLFYSSNGASGNYSTNENGIYTFYPAASGYKLSVSFSAFSTESGYDSLNIFNGNSTSATLLSTTSGSTLPASQTSTAADGSLTFRFKSDISIVSTGWTAVITNVPGSPISTQPTASTTVCAGTAVSLSVGTYPGTPTYLWYSNTVNSNTGGTSTGVTTASYSPSTSTSGTTYYYCVVTNECSVAYTTNTAAVIVNPLPTAITGNTVVCSGATITLASTPTGGTWTVSDGSIATITSGGVVTGLGSGNTTVTYTSTLGCIRTAAITVNASPAAIGGNAGAICPTTGVLFLTDVSGAGTWTSSSASIASVGSSSGTVAGVSGGTAVVTFTLASNSCTATTVVTVTPSPLPISGTLSVCPLLVTPLSDASGGGTWTSSNAAVASISSSTGVVTGVTAGTTIITFTLASTGCSNTAVVTVNSSPAAITGTLSACITSTSTLSDATPGGTWSVSDAVIATVDGSGVVTAGSVAGTNFITYTALGCPAIAQFAVNGSPDPAITGTTVFCTGTTTTLANAGGVGNWTSGNPSVAIAGATTGIITGASAGTATISYSNGCGTPASIVVTVNQTPTTIVGSGSVCMGSTSAYSNGATGGTWSSTNTGVATISSSGIVTPVAAGTTNINYTLGNGCVDATMPIAVNAMPDAISGASFVCVGSTITLGNTASNGTWSSSDNTVATVGSNNGVVTGLAQGTVTVTYQNGCGSAVTTTITVGAAPATITGSTVACIGSTTTLFNTSTGGTWSSTNSGVASVGSATGIVTGNTVGTATISYITGCGTAASVVVTASSSSSAITGTLTVCQGSTTALSSAPSGGTWTSGDITIASVNSSGTVTGVNNGTVVITYSSGCGTPSTAVVTVNTYASCATSYCAPASSCSSSDVITNVTFAGINNTTACANLTLYTTPVAAVSQGATVPFTMTVTNGGTEYGAVWIDYNHNGTFDASEYTFIGSGAGFTATANISIPATALPGVTRMRVRDRYNATLANTDACTVYSFGETEDYYVNISCNTPAITGTTSACVAGSTTLADATSGGSWISANTSIATVGSASGVVTGVAAGTAVISYVVSGCYTTKTVTINQPAAISGSSAVCLVSTTSLTDVSGAGTWISSNTGVATVGSSTGVVTGAGVGTANITFTLTSSGCTISKTISVNPLPASITGTMSSCVGTSSSLSDASGTGTWSSSNTSVATVGAATGVVTGVTVGTATISFTSSSTGCSNTTVFAVNASPSAITGVLSACITASNTLSSATPGGTWSSSNTSVATVNSSGVVTAGAVAGTATISYIVSGCPAVATFTVNGSPLAIIGTTVVCAGATTTLSNSGGSGTWASADASVATANSSGVITGVASGTVIISYSNGCGTPATTVVTVLPTPASIMGTQSICVSGSTTLGNSIGGGTWTSANTAVASIDASAGIVTALAQGTSTISYSLGNGCAAATRVETVNGTPSAISGSSTLCTGGTTTFTNTATGGTWSSSNLGVATVNSTTGLVTAVGQGNATITYSNGCGADATRNVTVNGIPTSISGVLTACPGTTSTLTNTANGGTWSSTNTSVATIGATSGTVTGVAAGTTTISYSNGCGTGVAAVFTVSATSPSAFTISPATATICSGNGQLLTAPTPNDFTNTFNSTSPVTVPDANATGITNSLTVSGIPTGATVADISVVLNSVTMTFDGDLVFNIQAPNGNILNLVNQRGGSGANFTNTTISSIGSTALSTGTAPFTGTFAADAASAVGPTTSTSNVTAWSSLTSIPNGTWTLAVRDMAGGDVATVNNWSVVIHYTVPVNYTWAPTAGLYTNPGLTTSYTGAITNTVYASPASTTTYTATAAYTGGACTKTSTVLVSVNPTPAPITGTGTVCVGATTSLNSTTSSGTWSSSNGGVATVNSSGVVSGVAAGTATISYIMSTGCFRTTVVTVNPIPTVNTVSNQLLCNGVATTAVNFSGAVGGTTYNWTNDNTSIGLAASGSGNISSFTAVNAGTSATIANVTVTPSAAGCVGSSTSFTITVKPTPTVSTVSNQTLCNGAPTTAVSFSGAVAGTVYSWTNTNSSIGLAASGTGDIASFSAINGGTSAVTANITVTPSASGCAGSSTAFTISVKPTPTVAAVSNQSLCNGTSTSAVNFSGAVSGTAYNWTNDNTSVGLGASGIGNIASFTAVNTGTSAAIANITVTPSAAGCTGSSLSFTITAKPTPTVASVSNQSLCNGVATAAVSFSGAVSGTTYNWTNTNTSIGIAASGSGDIAPFTAINAGTSTATANITVTPSASGCAGSSTAFTITVKPTPTVAVVSNQSVCNGASTATVNFSGAVSGTTYSWTNDNTSIGLAASGVGNIASFAAVNAGTSSASANIMVTPLAAGCGGSSTSFSIGVKPTPTVATVSDQSVCNGSSTATVSFSGAVSGTTYNWTNDNTSIGIAASGVGTIASFTALNTGSSPISANITVVPSAAGCVGASTSFTISVKPTPTVATVSNQSVCNGTSTAAISFGGTVIGTSYSWTNDNASIGLAASGAGDIVPFVATNGGSSATTANITVTPSASGCSGASTAFTISVKPTPTAAAVSDQSVCNGASAAAVSFSGAVSGTTYNWTNDNNSIGLAGNGTGDIASFTAVNSGASIVTANITVTPSAGGCSGSSTAFAISVKPTPTVATVGNQSVCNGSPTATVSFSGAGIGATYSWVNDNTSIGLAGTGAGDIASFTAVNTGSSLAIANITVTPTVAGCVGTPTSFTISVKPTPTIATVSSQSVCNGSSTSTISFSGAVSGTTYSWTNDNSSIGLAASGAGNIASFTVNNAGSSVAVANIMVTPSAASCNGSPASFAISVKPTPTVAIVANQSGCNGASTAPVSFNGSVSGTTFGWTNDNTSIGLDASGTGDISSFTGVNTASSVMTAHITVTPSASGCVGTPMSFAVSVKPTPTVNTVSNQLVCNGASTDAVNFSGAVSGTTYSWTSDNTAIGIAGSGVGSIASFTAINAGSSVAVANITVTPSAGGCAGAPTSFTIGVKPMPVVAAVSNQAVCNGAATAPVNFSGAGSGAVYSWTNDNASIGLEASGTGDIAAFAAVNTGSSVATANITVTPLASGCIGSPISFTISVKPTPTVAQASNQFVCNGASTTAVSFSGAVSGTTYSWANDNTSVGLAASGTGDIASFAAVNAGSSVASANIAVTPLASGCVGTPMSFAINVKPTPTVAAVSNQSVCNGSSTTNVNFSGDVSGTAYTWTNDNTSIGLAGSGVGAIASFTAVNTGSSVATANITVTPSAGGCAGLPTTFTIGVKPTPTVSAIADQAVCNGASTAAVNFSGIVGGTTYSWTNDNSSIGLGASGTGNIASFAAVNSGSSIATANISVTPIAAGCVGSSASFMINVKPTPTVAVISNQSVCNGSSTATVNFNGAVSGTTYGWTNDNTSIGLAASGTGNIIAFNAINTGSSISTGNITVTPVASGCAGSPTSFAISVKPTPVVATVSNQSVCNGAATAAISFSGTVSGTTYSWTNDNASIGLSTSGIGDIASFTTANTGSSIAIANIAVTPSAAGCVGSPSSFVISVKPTPTVAAVSNQSVCNNTATSAISFSGAVSGTTYSWSNDNASIGLASSGAGNIASFTAANTGSSVTTANITVTPSANGCTGLPVSFAISVKPTPSATTISNQSVCNGASTSTVSFSGSVGGAAYSWTNDNTSIGLNGSGTGDIASFTAVNTGSSLAIANITVTPSAAGCTGLPTSFTISVKPTPTVAAVSGQSVCNGSATATVNFNGAVGSTAYSWTNDNTSIGLAGSGSGNISSFTAINTGSSVATANITVTPSASGCAGSPISFAINVKPTPTVATVSNQLVCNSAATTAVSFSGAVSGTSYNWTNDNTSIGLAASGTGDIAPFTAVNNGSSVAVANVMVTPSAAGCAGTPTSFSVSVKPTPTVAAISNQSVCNGASTALVSFNGAVSGTTYSWTNDNASIGLAANGTGAIAPFTAVNTGSSVAIANITVTPSAAGCAGVPASFSINVKPTPTVAAVSNQSVCNGAATTAVNFNGTVSGTAYSWTNDNSSIGLAVSGSGNIAPFTSVNNGTSAAMANITVTPSAAGCVGSSTSFTIGVKPTPTVATVSNQALCNGASTAAVNFSGTVSGTTYSWTNNNTSVGLGASGIGDIASFAAVNTATTVATANIVVTPSASGCVGSSMSFAINVNPDPLPITGTMTVCTGLTTTLGDGMTGGTWSSSTTSVATISNAGVVTGVASGVTNITYRLATGCMTMAPLTVNPLPAAISGATAVVVGQAITLGSTTSGGTWSSSNMAAATVGAGTGVVAGVAAGTTIITYALPTGCIATHLVTVHPLPANITGTMVVCAGSTTTLVDTTAGGTWISGNPAVATVTSATGIVAGVSAGTAVITYLLPTSAQVTTVVTVNSLPAAITGTTTVCNGLTTTLNTTTTGGAWTSGDEAVASINNAGVVAGVSPGIAIITYTALTGCYTTRSVTVNALPSAITGVTTVCSGLTSSLSDNSIGGSWSSGNTSVATVNGAGLVSGVSAGTTIITYMLPTGCISTANITVIPLPASIGGAHMVCVANVTTLTTTATGGTWTSNNTSIAAVDATTGIVSGISVGNTVISYTLGTGCYSTYTFTVNSVSPITGTGNLCIGTSTTLSDATSGGSWSSSDASVAVVNSGTGIVSGVASGLATISYVTSVGCIATTIATVAPALTAITGNTYICAGTTSTLSQSIAGGVWSISNAAIASIGSATGIVTGLTTGTAVVTYATSNGCRVTTSLQVYSQPSAISGTLKKCPGYTSALTDATPGGYWTSSDATIASVDSNSGIVMALATGMATISYTAGVGCFRTATFTVDATPSPITGSAQVCVGLHTTLSNATPGMVWSSGNTSVATISSSTGDVTGVSAGTAAITYTLGTGCYTTAVVTVNSPASAITGSLAVCSGQTTSLAGSTSGGTWTSSNTSVATIDASGVVSGITSGSSTISYTLGTGCVRTGVLTVNPVPNPITGTASACVGMTSTLNVANTGGVWSSSNSSIASITPSRVVTGVAAGTATISYTFSTGCASTVVFTVNAAPMPIFGTATVCPGLTTTMHTSSTGGTWSSGNTAVATIGSTTGVITGVAAGTTNVSYIAGAGCNVYTTITVSAAPAVVNGASSVCPGATATLTDATTGGSWSSSDVTLATVGSSNGVVSGVSAGTVILTYAISTGCIQTKIMTVNPLPSAISGSASICPATSSTLSDATTGGTWISGTTSIATIGITSGIISGVAAGTSTITYTLSTGCKMTTVATVNPLPVSISGTLASCIGTSSSLSNTVTGGNWSSGNTTVATVDGSGVVTGVASGTATITYTIGSGCFKTAAFTVNPSPSAISGAGSVCIGGTSLLNSATSGGTWMSGNTAVATIGSTTRVVTGLSAGTADISYVLPTGCMATTTITVNSLPSSITGTASVCMGNTTTLANATNGGSWSTSNAAVATIDATAGIVTGIAAGTATITYTVTGSCLTTAVVTVNGQPGLISGTLTVCEGSTTALSDAPAGGTWYSNNASVATINASGVVAGVVAGTAGVTYTSAAGCTRGAVVTVNPVPAPITGANLVCVGSTASVADATPGGTWGASTPTVLGGPSGNLITGISAGTSAITYALPTGCVATSTITVNAVPGAISGSTSTCQGTTSTLSDATGSGIWSSSDATIAAVGSMTGVVTGIAAGTASITYMLSTGCYKTTSYTVKALPDPISGTLTLCQGTTSQLSDATSGGVSWASGNTSTATVSSTGIVTGVSAGTATITYALGTGCWTTADVTVMPLPPSISGAAQVCLGLTATLSNTASGGTWASANNSIASVDASGVVSGIATGSTTITYTNSTGCVRTTAFVVNPLPPAVSGFAVACVGTSVNFTSGSGGTWTSGNTAIATVQPVTGQVTGVSAGTATISYTFSTGCYAVRVVTINAAPTAISGPSAMCIGATATMTNGVTGGTWSSTYPTTASIGSTSGIITGLSQGTSTITYSFGTGCRVTTNITVSTSPAAITGTPNICVGSSATLTDGTAGGAWSSGNTSVAMVGTSGIVTGVSGGTATISYTNAGGCSVTTIATVNSLSPITGTTSLCAGATTSLGNVTTGGNWSSSNSTVASVNLSGVVTGGSAGAATITYMLPTGCYTTTGVTVNPVPSAIGGVASVCVGATTTLSNTLTGGTWTSDNTSVATINSNNGVVAGIIAGVAGITYTSANGCMAATVVTVNALPTAITGNLGVCLGATTTLSNTTPGGGWTSSDASVASVDVAGVVTGASVGTATITYQMSVTGCSATAVVTVNAAPAAIAGASSLCTGSTITLTNTTAGGSWTSGSGTVATVGASTGIVTGVAAGIAPITYSTGAGCITTTAVTVNNVPGSITGITTVCAGNSASLANAVAGGVWSSSNNTIANVNPASGVVSGVSGGVATISYTMAANCSVTTQFTVNPATPIVGGTTVCVGTTATLTNSTAGGTWSSTNSLVASIGSTTGVVSGNSNGAATISYTMPGGCVATLALTVADLASPIVGPSTICAGTTATLTNTATGGSWSTNNATKVAIGSASGIITGVSFGSATITYMLATGCKATTVVSVNQSPNPIGGTLSVCEGGTTSLTDAQSGGTWSSTVNSLASISTGGVVSGLSAGNVVVTYSLSNGCYQTAVVTVNPLPTAISGSSQVCVGTTTTLTDVDAGGTWTTSNYTIANVATNTGVVTGMAAGNATLTYTLPTGCKTAMAMTVSPAPSSIAGAPRVCVAASITLTAGTGGTWSSAMPAIATVNSTTGTVTGISPGTVNINYYSPAGCLVSKLITVDPIPVPITGNMTACPGTTTTLSNTSGPAVGWTSGNTGVATVNVTYGYVTGVAPGTATISYTLGAGSCYATAVVTVNPLPATISGIAKACPGATTSLSDADAGGTWTSSNNTIATIDPSTGVATGIAAGYATITYTLATGCRRTTTLTVNPLPGAITGYMIACVGTSTQLSDGGGGTWSGTTSVATVGSNGVITGASAGTVNVTYSLNTGCIATAVVTVNPTLPASTGTTVVCVGGTSTLSNAVTGGTWSSGNVAVATIGSSSGILTGVGGVTVTISYSFGTGCRTTTVVTVNTLPAAITGTPSVCQGSITTLNDVTSGGTWSSTNAGVATVGTTGQVTGLSTGTTTISYTRTATGCASTVVVTVSPVPNAGVISSSGGFTINSVTPPTTVTLSSSGNAGGVWSSSNTSVATVAAGGQVTGIAAGTSAISYTVTNGCGTANATATITVTSARQGGNMEPVAVAIDVQIYPNPNKGVFTVKGALGTAQDTEVYLEVTDVLGQVVYRNTVMVRNGRVEEQIQLNNALANGMYMLTMHTAGERKVFHFAIEQ